MGALSNRCSQVLRAKLALLHSWTLEMRAKADSIILHPSGPQWKTFAYLSYFIIMGVKDCEIMTISLCSPSSQHNSWSQPPQKWWMNQIKIKLRASSFFALQQVFFSSCFWFLTSPIVSRYLVGMEDCSCRASYVKSAHGPHHLMISLVACSAHLVCFPWGSDLLLEHGPSTQTPAAQITKSTLNM